MQLSKCLGVLSLFNGAARRTFYQSAFLPSADFLKKPLRVEKFDLSLCTKLDANLYKGNLVFLSGPSGKAQVRMYSEDDPAFLPKVSVIKDTLHIHSDSFKPFGEQKPPVTIEVTIPPLMTISAYLKLGGSVYLDRLSGDIDIFMRAGEIRGVSHAKHAKVTLHAGRVNLQGLRGDAVISNKMGDIKVGFDVVDAKSQIDLRTHVGNVDLYVPETCMAIDGYKMIKSNGGIANSLGANIRVHSSFGKIIAANHAGVEDQAAEREQCRHSPK